MPFPFLTQLYTKGWHGTVLVGGSTWVNFCWVCATDLLLPLPHYSLFCGQL